MKKLIWLPIVIVVLFFTSCSMGGTDVFKKAFVSDAQIADQTLEQVMSAIQKEDKEALKNLFSKKCVADTEDFDAKVTALMDYYKGEMTSYNNWGALNTNEGMNEDGTGRSWKNLQATYDVDTDKTGYRVAFQTCVKDTADADNIGIYSFYVIKAEDMDMQIAYWGDGKWTPGINIDIKR